MSTVGIGLAAPAAGRRSALVLGGRTSLVVVASLLAAPLVTGCLYWLRQPMVSLPGPRVQDALPLDQLAHHSTVPLVGFVAVFALVAGLIAQLAGSLGSRRTTLALALGLGVGATLIALDTFSIYVVVQIPLSTSFEQAVRVEPVYLAAATAGAAGALLGRPVDRASPSWSRILGLLTTALALAVLVTTAVTLVTGRVSGGVPLAVRPDFAAAVLVPAAAVLLRAAGGISRSRRHAFLLALVLVGAATIFPILRDERPLGAVLPGLIALLLVASRRDFVHKGSPSAPQRSLNRLALSAWAVLILAMVALIAARAFSGLPLVLGTTLDDSVRLLVGAAVRPGSGIPGGFFGEYFHWAVTLMATCAALWTVGPLLAPWEVPAESEERRRLAEEVVRRHGYDTLAPFALRHDKSLFLYQPHNPPESRFGSDRRKPRVLIAYRVVRGIALVSGDPIGPEDLVAEAHHAFVEFAHGRGWRVAILGVAERWRDYYAASGLRTVYHGDEAIIEVSSFSLEGGDRKAIRQAAHRLERKGYRSEVVLAGNMTAKLRFELLQLEREWLRGEPRKGFVMELDYLFRLEGNDAVFVVGRAPDGHVAGFLHIALCRPGRAMSLSSMPRESSTPNGFNSWLIIDAVRWGAASGYALFSLNFSPMARLLSPTDGPASSLAKFERRLVLAAKRVLSLQLDNLSRFNRQFTDQSVPRFVALERRTDLPLAGVAAMATEGYLPFSDLVRGRERSELANATLTMLPRHEPDAGSGFDEARTHPVYGEGPSGEDGSPRRFGR